MLIDIIDIPVQIIFQSEWMCNKCTNVYETKSHYKLMLIVIRMNKKNMLWYLHALQKNLSFSDIIGKRWQHVSKKDVNEKLAEALKPNLFKEL